ncbi:hypothetical protein [Micromonospora sp. NPDC126480]|uniref:hypothetical protein n=1 Tax=Micromonospora sp. NPDC126480 TaxID=3155312 RepID=UPI00331CBDAB
MAGQHLLRRVAVVAGLAAALLSGGCTREPEPEPPRPASTSPPSTLARAEVGDRLTVTAAVERIIDDGAIVVRDVDLTDGSLLVLTRQAVEARPPQLVTVEGTVVRFVYGDLAGERGLGDPETYRAFDGQKALAAGRITVWR